MSEAPVAPAHDVRPGKSARTRAALRDMALQHFVEHGFERASVPAIAAECGVTERTFYRHFATKDEVLTFPCAKESQALARAAGKLPSMRTSIPAGGGRGGPRKLLPDLPHNQQAF